MRVALPVKFGEGDERQLLAWSRGRSTPHRLILRSKIVLMAADGLRNRSIAERLHTRPETVALWRNRFIEYGLDGIRKDAPRPGRKPKVTQEKVNEIIDRTLHTKPNGATHWTTRTLAKEVGVGYATVHRIWKAHRIQPHRERKVKLSRDP